MGTAGHSRFWRLFLGAPRSRHRHLDALDGLRGFAVLVVVASHLGYLHLDVVPGIRLTGIGKSGVYLFFVLSAFLLTRAMLDRSVAALADWQFWANYALRRILRIWPLYLVVLLVSWALWQAGLESWPYQLDTDALLRHLALQEGQNVLWSIPVEFKFYLWLPLVALGLLGMRWRGWPLGAELAVVALVIATAIGLWPPAATSGNDVRLGPYLVLFLCGSFAARLDQRLADRTVSRPGAWGLLGFASLVVFAMTIPEIWARIAGTPVDPKLNHHWFLLFGLAWAGLLLAVLHGPGWLRRLFASAPMRLVGVVSFSAYLWHMPMLKAFVATGLAPSTFAAWGLVLAIVLVAMGSFLAIERPWREVRWPQRRCRRSLN